MRREPIFYLLFKSIVVKREKASFLVLYIFKNDIEGKWHKKSNSDQLRSTQIYRAL